LVKVGHEIASQIPGHFRFVNRWIGGPPAGAAPAPAVTRLKTHYSNEKIFFQSFFMLMTVQFFLRFVVKRLGESSARQGADPLALEL